MGDEVRGRGRGRGRGVRPPAAGGPPAGPTQPHQPTRGGGARVAQPGPAPQAGLPGRATTSRGRQQASGGGDELTSAMRGLAVKQEVTPAGPSGSGDTIGRGALRGTRTIERPTFIRTKPDSCANKQGVTGQKVVCTANYFAIETKADWHLYQYRVDFNPEEDRTMVKRALLSNHRAQLGGGFVFDGTMLFTHQRLAPDPMELVSKRKHDDQFITMTVRMVDKDAIKYGDQTYLQVLNIVVRKCIANLDMTLLGRNYYDPKAKITIPEFSLELWPGYLTSMRQHEHSFLLCVEIIHKVLRQDTAYDLLRLAMQRDSRNYQDIFRNEMIGQVVLTSYGNTATYKVDDVDFTSNPDTTFDMKGVKTTIRDYYNSKYGLKIQDGRQPLLVSRPKARDERGGRDGPIFLVPELCRMTGITDEMRNNQNLMRAMADRTRMDSRTRQERLMVFQKRFTQTPKNAEELKNWNLSLSKNLVSMNSRILPPERVLFGGGNAVTLDRGPDWTNNFRNCSLLATSAISNWVVVGLSNAQRDIQEFVSLLQKSARGMGLRIDQPQWMNLDDDRVNSCVGVLDRVLSRDLPQIILFPVSNNRADRYSAIKRKTYVDRAVPSQVVALKTLRKKGLMSIATKVAIQMSCKIGGSPWSVDIPIKSTMVIGYDVCHDAKQKTKSYGALVASLNASWSRYYSSVTHHQHGEEIFKDLPMNIIKAITKYQQHNENQLPNRLLIYRDGVGEGQVNKVFSREVEDVVNALQATYGEQAPKMAFIIVTKRLNSRIFLGNENPPAGTVVDDVITCPEKYDFFLIPQSVRQGTVSPAGYNVIYDKSGLSADHMQRITYKLCHLYFNWSGTVRVPAPCQYAHKLAFLCSQNLHGIPNEDLSDLLYFL
ncbi:piwi-like protein Siwi [Nilaparvata lugens]|uniref:piwi-like protein Siwi n=1 Tax=Nilaparvata lugens TaxID=108931 RepID=UPI00193E419B|nr:piwi-like protein Siwi [Nilaparvata lugens]XP_039277686.1 piwi-like protein Siwi [Nilaparvata lugens]